MAEGITDYIMTLAKVLSIELQSPRSDRGYGKERWREEVKKAIRGYSTEAPESAVEFLEGMPDQKIHCSVMGTVCLKKQLKIGPRREM